MIECDPTTATWLLTTPRTAYALRLGEDVRHVHWGPLVGLGDAAAMPASAAEELPGEGGERFGPPSLSVEFADGTRAVEWSTPSAAAEDGHLAVRLADRHYPLELELHYRVRPDSDVLERWTVLRNTGAEPVAVGRLDAANWALPSRTGWCLSTVAGEWAAEFRLRRAEAAWGETVFTSRRGTSRHQNNPWLSVDAGATEERGEVWSVALAWSGTYRIAVARTLADRLTVAAGAGHDLVLTKLRPGEEWRTPVCCGLYTVDGFGGASRAWHDHIRRHVLPAADEPRPVLYNGWEGTWFDVNEVNQREVAAIAAELGVELFVMDDGWFGRRLDDRAGLGDWWPNPDRFPDGLGPLVADVRRLGMRFGLWVEPEMVNPDSDLYRAHPDWVLHMPNRRRTEVRNQLVLNFARPDVVEWAYSWLDRIVGEHGIDFLKWDMNRPFTEAGWPGHEDPQRLWFGHTLGVYAVMDRLRAAHPGLRIESCASGGGRVDLGILARTDQAWTSDNTDPVDRIAIQHGYGQVYPAITMGAWASDSPNPLNGRATPLRFRFHVAMAGALGVSGNLRRWSTEERREAAALIAEYKRIRHIVQHGSLYRLTPASAHATTAVQYVTADRAESAVLAWRAVAPHNLSERPLRLAGLDPAARYADATGASYPGAVLLHHGLPLELPRGDHASACVHLTALG